MKRVRQGAGPYLPSAAQKAAANLSTWLMKIGKILILLNISKCPHVDAPQIRPALPQIQGAFPLHDSQGTPIPNPRTSCPGPLSNTCGAEGARGVDGGPLGVGGPRFFSASEQPQDQPHDRATHHRIHPINHRQRRFPHGKGIVHGHPRRDQKRPDPQPRHDAAPDRDDP